MGTLHIDLLGTSFSIEAKEDNQYLQELLSYYIQITKEVKLMSNNKDPQKIAILAGIMICDELFKDRTKAEELKKFLETHNDGKHQNTEELYEVEKRTLQIIQNIDRLLT